MANSEGIQDHSDNAEALAARYAETDKARALPELFEFLNEKKRAGESLSILDIGAGSGDCAYQMAQMGHNVVAVEPSELLTIAKRKYPHEHITYVQDTLPLLSQLNTQKYDIVLLDSVWQYIDPNERIPSLERIAKLLAPQGKLLINFPHLSREFQFPIEPETFSQELEIVNSTLPKSQRLCLTKEPAMQEDFFGRLSLDGRPLHYWRYNLSSIGHARSAAFNPEAVAR